MSSTLAKYGQVIVDGTGMRSNCEDPAPDVVVSRVRLQFRGVIAVYASILQ
ncbi:MAG: hypothetical protein ACP5H2_09155 [Solirubrobacteraceae bacterium]